MTIMKSPSQTQSTSNTNPATLSNSMLQALYSNAEFPVLPTSTMTNTSPESAAVKRKRLSRILDSAIAIIDGDDLNPIKASTTHQRTLQ
jgi:hypothetical protein